MPPRTTRAGSPRLAQFDPGVDDPAAFQPRTDIFGNPISPTTVQQPGTTQTAGTGSFNPAQFNFQFPTGMENTAARRQAINELGAQQAELLASGDLSQRFTQSGLPIDIVAAELARQSGGLGRNVSARTAGGAVVGAPTPEITAAGRNIGLAQQAQLNDPVATLFTGRAIGAIGGFDPFATQGSLANLQAVTGRTFGDLDQRRGQEAGARAAQVQALQRLAGIAGGRGDSPIDIQAQLARENLRQQTASQLASQRGGFSPAAQRAALLGLSQGQAQLGAQTAAARAEEQRQALNQLIEGQAALRAQDVQGQLAAGQLGIAQGSVIGQAAGLQDLQQQRQRELAQLILGRGDRARQEAFQALGLGQAGLRPEGPEGPGFAETLLRPVGQAAGAIIPFLV